MPQNRQGSVQVERHQGDVPQERALTVSEVRSELDAIRPQLEEVLPQRMDPDRFLRVVAGAVLKSPDLLKCDRISLFRAVLESAQLGLEPTGLLGSAYLVPYRVHGKLQATLIPGYRGLIDLARRSGEIESIYAQIVREKDYFRIRQGTDPGIDHEQYIPPPGSDPESDDPEKVEAAFPGPIVGAYMVAVLRDRSGNASIRQIEWMTKAEIDAVRRRSRASGAGPWVSDYSEMARKTVVRRGAKYLPLTPEAVRAFSLDEEAERAADETGAAKRQSGRSRLLQTMASRRGITETPETDQEVEGEATEVSGQDQEEEGSATASASSGVALCGEVPPDDGLGMTEACGLSPDHKGAHRSNEGSWPR
jgi:recombination protein RecT